MNTLTFRVNVCCFVISFALGTYAADPPKLTAAQQTELEQTRQDLKQAEKLHDAGEYQEAEKLSAKILETRRRLLGENHLETAEAYNLHGLSIDWLGDQKGALELSAKGLEICERIGGESEIQAVLTRNFASAACNLGELKKAGEYHQKSLALAKKVWEPNHKRRGLAHLYYGVYLRTLGNYAEAMRENDLALSILEKAVGREDTDTLSALYCRAIIVDFQGDVHQALKLYQELYELRNKFSGPEHSETLSVLTSVADKYLDLRNYPEARRLYEEALRTQIKMLGADHSSVAETINSLGVVFESQGDYEGAKRQYEEALRVRKKVFGEESYAVGYSLSSLGNIQFLEDDYTGAEFSYNEALRIMRQTMGEEHLATAGVMNSLADVYAYQRFYSKARPLYEKVLEIRRKQLGEKHLDTAVTYSNLGELLRMRGNYIGARPYLEKCVQIRQSILGPQHLDVAYALDEMAVLEGNLGNFTAASAHSDSALRLILNHAISVLPSLTDKEQLAFLNSSLTAAFHRAMTFGVMRPENPSISAFSAEWSLNGKGITQNALAERILLLRDLESTQPGDLASKLLETRRRLATLTLSIPEKDQQAARLTQIQELTEQEEQLTRQISRVAKSPHAGRSWIELQTLRAAVPPGSALIDITMLDIYNFQAKGKETVWLPARYVAWIIPPPGKDQIQIVDLGLCDEINEAIQLVSETMAEAARNEGLLRTEGEKAAVKQFDSDFSAVSDMIWPSLEPRLPTGTKNLILSPDGMLWLLPWAALPLEGNKYLLEKYSLRFITSSRDLLPKPALDKTLTTSAPLIFADPDFDLSADGTSQAIKKIYPNIAENSELRGISSQSALPSVSRLPNTEIEAEAIKANVEKIAKAAPQLYIDRFALEAVVKRISRPKILVLSTHGFFLPDQDTAPAEETDAAAKSPYTLDASRVENPLLRCGLLLAGCNTRQSAAGEDGVLTGMEIVGLDLRGTELVVLSACETGQGKINNGEGVAGLRQAFQLAGANAVVSTLWQVPDRDTAILMNDFFANMAAGQSKPDALRNAQLKRITARRDRFGAAHPLYWAAWTLTGN